MIIVHWHMQEFVFSTLIDRKDVISLVQSEWPFATPSCCIWMVPGTCQEEDGE